MDKKIRFMYMLSTRDTLQNERYTQTKRDEKIYFMNMEIFKNWDSNTYIRQNRFQKKGHKKRQGL